MANSDLDDFLAMIDSDEEEQPKRKSSQQTLRDRMLNESRNSMPDEEDVDDRELELEQEIIDEEVEEENKPGINPKIIIVAAIAGIIVLILLIGSAVSKKRKADEEARLAAEAQAQAEAMAQAQVVEEPEEDLQPSNWGALIYTDEQIINLRNAGLTQEAITKFQNDGVPYDYIYFTYLEQYYAWQLNNQLPILDTASPEFKEVIDDTWLTLDKRTDTYGWTSDYIASTYEEKQNFDYEKVEPYGNQLFLKIYLDAIDHDSFFLLNISPDDWNKLDDKGNVVVSYTYVTHYLPAENQLDRVEDTDHIFITSAQLDIIESLQNRNNQTFTGE